MEAMEHRRLDDEERKLKLEGKQATADNFYEHALQNKRGQKENEDFEAQWRRRLDADSQHAKGDERRKREQHVETRREHVKELDRFRDLGRQRRREQHLVDKRLEEVMQRDCIDAQRREEEEDIQRKRKQRDGSFNEMVQASKALAERKRNERLSTANEDVKLMKMCIKMADDAAAKREQNRQALLDAQNRKTEALEAIAKSWGKPKLPAAA